MLATTHKRMEYLAVILNSKKGGGGGGTSLRRMSMGLECTRDMQVAMGRAVYGTPHMTLNSRCSTFCHISSETCKHR